MGWIETMHAKSEAAAKQKPKLPPEDQDPINRSPGPDEEHANVQLDDAFQFPSTRKRKRATI